MSSSASSAIAEWEVTKNQGGLPRTMVRSSGMPAALIDLPVVHEVFGPPEDKDILVVDIVFLSADVLDSKYLLQGSTSPMISNQVRCRLSS
jgi:hypothetical protein